VEHTDNSLTSNFPICRLAVVLQQDPIFQRAMVALDLALRDGAVWFAPGVSHRVLLSPPKTPKAVKSLEFRDSPP
jgi:hypothetical protein